MRRAIVLTSGLTLVELMITVVIVAAVAVFAVPQFNRLLPETRLRGSAESIQQHMLLARSEAVRQNVAVNVVAQTGTNWCVGLTSSTTCDCAIANACNLGQIKSTEYPGLSLAVTNMSSNKVTFNAVRGAPDQNTQFTLSADGKSINVTINQIGRSSICSTTVKGYNSTC